MGERQHDPDRDRIFVRALEGKYSLKDELGRLRAMPRVIKGKELKLDGGPQHFSRHYVEPEDGRQAAASTSKNTPRQHHETRPSTRRRSSSTAPASPRSRRRALRLEGRRHRDRAQQLRPPALQCQRQGARARARDQDQADVPVHEHAVPAHRAAAPEDALPDPRQFRATPGGGGLQPSGREGGAGEWKSNLQSR